VPLPILHRRPPAALPRGIPPSPQRPPRSRRRRGGPRTPLPLLPIIAICTGVGLAYVNQTAKATQDNYDQSHLIYQQQQLITQDQQLGDQLASLSSSSRIIAAAERLGMVPGGTWTYAEEPAPRPGQPAVAASSSPLPAAGSPAAAAGLAGLATVLGGALGGGSGW
jgi:hypothetical protein